MANNVATQAATLATIPTATTIATFQLGTSAAHMSAVSLGGNASTAVAAGTAADSVIKATAGFLARVLVTTLGTNTMVIYDNASAGSGKIVGIILANSPAGTLIEIHMPCANGITVLGNAANPAVTIAWA